MSKVAKTYIKALVGSLNSDGMKGASDALNSIAAAFGINKFKNIVYSTEIAKDKKVDFILSMLEKPDEKITNFIKLLSENGRLEEIPAMAQELQKQIAIQTNTYDGVLISNFDVPADQIADIEKNLSTKLGSTIKLSNEVSNYPGLKVEVDNLGVEVGLSTDRVKAQLAEHILKAI